MQCVSTPGTIVDGMRILRIVPSSLSIRVVGIHARRICVELWFGVEETLIIRVRVEIPSVNEMPPIKYISLKT